MRMLLSVTFPPEPFNTLVKEKKAGQIINQILSCVFRTKLAIDSGVKLATDSGLKLATYSGGKLATFRHAPERMANIVPE